MCLLPCFGKPKPEPSTSGPTISQLLQIKPRVEDQVKAKATTKAPTTSPEHKEHDNREVKFHAEVPKRKPSIPVPGFFLHSESTKSAATAAKTEKENIAAVAMPKAHESGGEETTHQIHVTENKQPKSTHSIALENPAKPSLITLSIPGISGFVIRRASYESIKPALTVSETPPPEVSSNANDFDRAETSHQIHPAENQQSKLSDSSAPETGARLSSIPVPIPGFVLHKAPERSDKLADIITEPGGEKMPPGAIPKVRDFADVESKPILSESSKRASSPIIPGSYTG